MPKPYHRNIRSDFIEKVKRYWRDGMTRQELADAMGMKVTSMDRAFIRYRKEGALPPVRKNGTWFDPLGRMNQAGWAAYDRPANTFAYRSTITPYMLDTESRGGRH